jgi:hypothetical protein
MLSLGILEIHSIICCIPDNYSPLNLQYMIAVNPVMP